MLVGESGAYLGLLSFLSFGFSVIAAVLAIDMYTLLRTGEMGKTWRVLIIASVMFALAQVIRMAELLNWRMADYGLSQIVELVFVLALAYAFFLQRQTFTQAAELRGEKRRSLGSRRAHNLSEASDETSPGQATVAGSNAAHAAVKAGDVTDEDENLVPLGDDEDSEIEWSHSVPHKARTAVSGSVAARRH